MHRPTIGLRQSLLLAAALACAQGAHAATTTVQLESAGFTSNSNVIQAVLPGFGSSGPVTLNWDPFLTPNRALLNWRGSYSGRDAAYCGMTVASVCALDLTVDSGSLVTLGSFWFGSFLGANRAVDWSVLDLDGLGVVASGVATMVGAAGTTITVGATSASGFRILFSNDSFNNGINDIVYTSAPIPEPGSWALILAGLGAVGAAVHRRRRAQ